MNEKIGWNVYRTRFLVRARQLTEPLVFTDSLGREHSGQPGDYLVETSDGIRRVTSRTLFEDIYVPLTPAKALSPLGVKKKAISSDAIRPAPAVASDPRFPGQRLIAGKHCSIGSSASDGLAGFHSGTLNT